MIKNQLLIDLSDTIQYCSRSTSPSGIQRVVFSALKSWNSAPVIISYENTKLYFLRKDIDYNFSTIRSLCLAKSITNHEDFINAYPEIFDMVFNQNQMKYYLENTNNLLMLLGGYWNFLPYIGGFLKSLDSASNNIGFFIHDLYPITNPDFFNESLNIEFKNTLEEIIYHSPIKNPFLVCSSKHVQKSISENFKSEANIVPFSNEFMISDIHYDKFINHDSYKDTFLIFGRKKDRKSADKILDFLKNNFEKFDIKFAILIPSSNYDYYSSKYENLVHNNVLSLIVDCNDISVSKLYSTCKALIFPSSNEGWGLPITEASNSSKITFIPKNNDYSYIHDGVVKEYSDISDLFAILSKFDSKDNGISKKIKDRKWADFNEGILDKYNIFKK